MSRKVLRNRWKALQALRDDEALQTKHPVAEAKEKFGSSLKPCRWCGRPGDDLSWIFYESPPETWQMLCGRAGWIVVCDHCQRRVGSFLTLMN